MLVAQLLLLLVGLRRQFEYVDEQVLVDLHDGSLAEKAPAHGGPTATMDW